MKRNYFITILIAVLVALGIVFIGPRPELNELSTSPTPAVENEFRSVQLILDYGDENSEYKYEFEDGMTVLGVLEAVSEENQIELDTTYYEDFDSTLVNAIGGFENSKELSWIYFVNGNAGDVGADQKELQSGDLVEWKYVEPIY